MSFRFPLETLLRARRGLEAREEARLLALHGERAALRARWEQCRQQQAIADERQARELRQGLSAAELQFGQKQRQARQARERALLGEIAALETRLRERQQVFLRARRDRRMIERLREEQFAAYRREQTRREQQAQDELFLLRRRRHLAGPPAERS